MALPTLKGAQPVRTKQIDLDGDYSGWAAIVKVNPPASLLDEFSSGNIGRIGGALFAVLREWNYNDTEGEPLPLTLEAVNGLPIDLMKATVQKYTTALDEATEIPKP